MSMKFSLMILVIFLFLVTFNLFCIRNENPVKIAPNREGYGKISIQTEKNIYTWEKNNSESSLFIKGTLINNSDSTFYSKIGDRFAGLEQDHFYVARNSAGYIEKFDEVNKLWHVTALTGHLTEGTKTVPIQPSKAYKITAFLSSPQNQQQNGKYRITVKYFNELKPSPDTSPFKDYSNIFEIKKL